MAWPKGLKRKGFDKSGMTVKEWAKTQGFDLGGSPPKELDKGSRLKYECKKDGFGRVFIYVRNPLDELVGREQVNMRRGAFLHAKELGEKCRT